jgi:hypothetical protein
LRLTLYIQVTHRLDREELEDGAVVDQAGAGAHVKKGEAVEGDGVGAVVDDEEDGLLCVFLCGWWGYEAERR